jgi:hypothetical protein
LQGDGGTQSHRVARAGAGTLVLNDYALRGGNAATLAIGASLARCQRRSVSSAGSPICACPPATHSMRTARAATAVQRENMKTVLPRDLDSFRSSGGAQECAREQLDGNPTHRDGQALRTCVHVCAPYLYCSPRPASVVHLC